MVKMPRVSIGMPVYNGEKYIRDALESLLAQDFNDFELIVSDNASIDNTERICREYQARDSRIAYYRQDENKGAVSNFSFVLGVSTAEYFMWAAVDDRWHPSFLEVMIKSLDANPDVGLAFSQVAIIDLVTGRVHDDKLLCSSRENKFLRVLSRVIWPCPSLVYGLHRSSYIKAVGIANCDYFDAFLSIWYELNSSIWISRDCLYFAGVKGKRIPYALGGGLVSISTYLTLCFRLYSRHFSFLPSRVLSLVTLLLALRMNLKNNLLILRSQFVFPA